MDKQSLLSRQQVLESNFNGLRQRTDSLREQVAKNEQELLQLQGRHAEIGELIAMQQPEEDKTIAKTEEKEANHGSKK